MYRKIEKTLIEWKVTPHHKPLIITGPRQSGKTYSVLKFAKENYQNILHINFERDHAARDIFAQTNNPEELLMLLKMKYPNVTFDAKDCLIFLDEIQVCPSALTALKFLGTETPYDYIVSGSLLGVAITHTSSYPVGYVTTVHMQPMDFEEFLIANQIDEKQIHQLHVNFKEKKPVLSFLHELFMDLFRKYMICGGMPEVVSTWIHTKDYQKVRENQEQIIQDYIKDMSKYSDAKDYIKIHQCFESIPLQLAKENKKFQYKLVQKGGSAKHFDVSLQWLKDAGVIQFCHRLKTIDDPLKAYYEPSIYKLYLSDTGLLCSMLGEDCAIQIMNNQMGVYKGAIYENIAAQLLKQRGYELFYFEPSSHSEIDFIIHKDQMNIPLEIKSSNNTRARSLKAYVEKYQPQIAMKFSTQNVSVQGSIVQYPLYMLMFL